MNIIGKTDGSVQVGWRWNEQRQRGHIFVDHWPAGPLVSVGDEALREAPKSAHIVDFEGRRLYILDHDFVRLSTIAAVIGGPLWWMAVVRYYLSVVEIKLLWTLRLWGLAKDDMMTSPSWGDVYFVRWIRR